MTTKMKSLALVLTTILIPIIFLLSLNIYARNFTTDINLPLPQIVQEEGTIRSTNCSIAVQAELEFMSFNGFPNGYNFESNGIMRGTNTIYDSKKDYSNIYFLKKDKSVYNIFCKTKGVDSKVSKSYIEYNSDTGESKVMELSIAKKLFLKNY